MHNMSKVRPLEDNEIAPPPPDPAALRAISTEGEDSPEPNVKVVWGKDASEETEAREPRTPITNDSTNDGFEVGERHKSFQKLLRSATAGESQLGSLSEKRLLSRTNTRFKILATTSGLADIEDEPAWKRKMRYGIAQLQKFSLPLICGVLIALVWSNADETGYHKFIDGAFHPDLAIDGHPLSLHFIVNDFFMCFFFGLAIKEVTEALLPGGSLSPLKRAVNPLVATLGGVLGPVAVYLATVLIMDAAGALDIAACLPKDYDAHTDAAHRRLAGSSEEGPPASAYTATCELDKILKGWGVPTATDISLAWMFALQIFGVGHPAINFMLLLAILDDALGMIIIACFYSDPNNPVEPVYLLFVVLAMVLAFGLRKLNTPFWQVYILICGPVSWTGLFKAHVHPALSLVFVVPFIPACHALEASDHSRDLGGVTWWDEVEEPVTEMPSSSSSAPLDLLRTRSFEAVHKMESWLGIEEHAPLHVFEHSLKLPVDLGMFFFGLANAGVKLGSVGGVTTAVVVALFIGKLAGISLMSLLAMKMGFPLPPGVGLGDLLALSALGGVGLTVALFVSNEAFVQPELRGQAKMGAVLSVGCVFFAYGIRRLVGGKEVDPDAY